MFLITALQPHPKEGVDQDLHPQTVALVVAVVVAQEVAHLHGQVAPALVIHHPVRVNEVLRNQRKQKGNHLSK